MSAQSSDVIIDDDDQDHDSKKSDEKENNFSAISETSLSPSPSQNQQRPVNITSGKPPIPSSVNSKYQKHHQSQKLAASTTMQKVPGPLDERSSDLESLLVDQIAACHLKDDEILALEQNLRTLFQNLEQERKMSKKFKEEISVVEESLVNERSARKNADAELEQLKSTSAPLVEELEKVKTELVSVTMACETSSASSSTSGKVSQLIRALMSLQLDLIRTFAWVASRLVEDWQFVVRTTVIEPEQEEIRRMFEEFENQTRKMVCLGQEEQLRSKIYLEKKAVELRIVATSAMLSEHTKVFAKNAFEYCTKTQTEWMTVSSIYYENQRKVAALKLRGSNSKLKKALEDLEEKNGQIEEAKRNYNLLKARFDVRVKEQAAKISSSTPNAKMQNSNRPRSESPASKTTTSASTSASASTRKNSNGLNDSSNNVASPKQRPSSATNLYRKSSVTNRGNTSVSASSQTNLDASSRPSTPPPGKDGRFIHVSIIDDNDMSNNHKNSSSLHQTPTSATKRNTNWQFPAGNNSMATPTPPPPQQQHQGSSSHNTMNENNPLSNSAQFLYHQHQSVSGVQTPAAYDPRAASTLYNDLVSMIGTLEEQHFQKEFVTKISQDVTLLRKHLNLLEEAIVKKDERLNRVLEERNALNRECDTIASQCRLLEQAVRFGAKQVALERANNLANK